MSKIGTLKGVIKKILECVKSVDVTFNNLSVLDSQLLKNKVCIVTGASNGIGKAIAEEIINCGGVVIGIARDGKKLEVLGKKYVDFFIPFQCDIADVNNVDRYLNEILKKIDFKHISVLVNCAGIKNGNDERFFGYTPEDFDDVLNVNIRAPFFWSQKVASYMIDNKIQGHIVNVASIKGFIGEASPYGISKWGCVCLTKGLGKLLAGKGIVVNGIAPGGTATDMACYKEGDSLTHMVTPNMRLALPSEMAKLVVFLASDFGSNIIGQVIISDGGQVL